MTEGAKRTSAVVRVAGTEDFEQLAALLMECFDHYGDHPQRFLPEVLGALRDHGTGAGPAFEALLAEVGGPHGRRRAERQAVGFAIFGNIFWTGDLAPALFLKEIYVQPAFRGQGLGRSLMASLARVTLQRQWRRIVWTVDHDNPTAARFYETLPGAALLGKRFYGITEENLEDVAGRI